MEKNGEVIGPSSTAVLALKVDLGCPTAMDVIITFDSVELACQTAHLHLALGGPSVLQVAV